jgi:hypothetical protein
MRRTDMNDTQDQVVGDAIRRLAVPEPREGFFEQLRRELNAQRRRRHRRVVMGSQRLLAGPHVRLRALLVTAVASLLLGGVIGASVSGAADNGSTRVTHVTRMSSLHVPAFRPSEGWNVVTASIMVRSDSSPVAWAANVPFEPEPNFSGFPDNTVKHLSAGGIVISVLGPRPVKAEARFPDISEPLTLSAGNCVTSYEGAPRPDIALCPLDRKIEGDQVLNILVWFGTAVPGAKPSDQQLETANAELGRLLIP